jgi:4-amino-4-deoxy-L-arabinose transferase-like glycosyltransferase
MESPQIPFYNKKELSPRVVCRNMVGLILVGVILRIVVAEVLGGGLNGGYQGDEGEYVSLATHVVQGQGLTNNSGIPTSYHPPGLPLLLAMLISITGPQIVLIRMFMSVVGALLIPACYLLSQSLTGSQKVGWIAAAIAVFFPTWVISSSSVLSDIPAAISVTLMAWMLIEGYRRQSLVWIAGAGILWGTATLMRAGCLIYAPGIVLWLLCIMPGWKRRLAAVVATIVPFACVLAPWSMRNTHVHGTFVLISTHGGTELYKANNPDATGILAIDHPHFDASLSQRYPEDQYPNEIVRSKLFQADAVKFIRENPWRFAQLCFIRFIQLWKLYSPRVPLSHNLVVIASFGVALPFFLIQVIRLGRRRGPEMLFLLIILCQTGLHMVYTSIVRYRIPIEPLVVVMAITGFCWALGRFRCGYGSGHSVVK